MFDRILKFGAVSMLLMVGAAILPAPQSGQYKYLADGITLFDARTGTVIEQDLDAVLPKQYRRTHAVNQREALADCRSSMEITVAQRKLAFPPSTDALRGIDTLLPQLGALCVSKLLSPSGRLDTDKTLVSDFCEPYPDPRQVYGDPEIEWACAGL
jgi:hypothetical protein